MKFRGQKFWFSTNVEKGDPNLGGEGTAEVKLTRIGNGVAPRTLGRRKEQGNQRWKQSWPRRAKACGWGRTAVRTWACRRAS